MVPLLSDVGDVHGADRRTARRAELDPVGKTVRSMYWALGVLLVAYYVSVIARGGNYNTALDGWCVDVFELIACGLCFTSAVARRSGRGMAIALGLGLTYWTLGDIALTIESLGGRSPSTPSLADLSYLGFYPMAYIAVVLFMRGKLRRLAGPSWLDGIVAGLGAAALCATFDFHGLARAAGTGTLATATNLAYPIGDMVLLGLVVGGYALLPGSFRGVWLLLSVGLGVVVVGDTVNVFSNTLAASRPGSIIDALAWPTATLVMSAAPWQRIRADDIIARRREAGFFLPGMVAACALGIAFAGTMWHLDRVGLALAGATLVVAGVRLAVSARALRMLSRERHDQSITDELTGLRNRRFLSGLLEDFFAERDGFGPGEGDLAFLYVDLDRFKEVNDSFGHPAGDELLRQVGPRFRACLRSSDVIVRVGGDEFAVLLFGAEADGVTDVARRLSASLNEPFLLRTVKARIGASIGIAMASRVSDGAELMSCADVAMFRAKQSGSGFALYGHDLDGADRLQLAQELRSGIEEGQLALHYQPQMDLRTGGIMGAEALLRWVHPEHGLIPPLQFVPLAEEAGLMYLLTEFVLEQAVGQGAAWHRAGQPVTISVNVSATDLLRAGFADMVRGVLKRHGLVPEALVVEITETCVVDDLDRSRAVVEELRSDGIVVSLDDFGAGATSLAYLSNLGVGELKLDRSFIKGLCGAGRRRESELVQATIELGHAMGLRVVAEGIEDKPTLDLLAEMGCDLAQGYYVSMPKPPEELTFRPHLALPAPAELAPAQLAL
jgi:diguanylate cyclase (GGDEF)-like protein